MWKFSRSKISGSSILTAILSLLTIGAALSIGVAKAADDVTEDQILQALAPAKKPLTRGLSMGPQTQTDPAAVAAPKLLFDLGSSFLFRTKTMWSRRSTAQHATGIEAGARNASPVRRLKQA